MERVEELIRTVNELKGELAKAFKTIAEKEAENQMLLEKIAGLEKGKQLQSDGNVDAREPEVNPPPVLERKAEEIIPKECWGLVFRNLDAEDLLSCRQVCKTFNQLMDLNEFSEKWKFHLILPLLFPYLKISDPDPWDQDQDRRTWEHLYNARLACRSWHHSIGKYTSEVHGIQNYLGRRRDMPLLTCFRTSEHIEEFQQSFGESNTNPFPSRSVCMSMKNEDEEESEDEEYPEDYYIAQERLEAAYTEKVGELLEQFGKHIFKLHLYFNEHIFGGPDNLTLCKLVKRISIHLPNLREFLLKSNRSIDDGEEVATYIAENALAELPNLRKLWISVLDWKLEDYLLEAFGPQLTHLETSFSNTFRFQMRKLQSLQKLKFSIRNPYDTIESFRYLQSPLKRLRLSCMFGSSQGTWNVDEVLRNLKHLPIELFGIYIFVFGRMNVAQYGLQIEEYNNTSIKTLIIHIERHVSRDGNVGKEISFNFLQALTKLENLELKFSGQQHPTTHPEVLRDHEKVKLNGYLFGEIGTDLPYRSNVWEKVPSLKTLTLIRKDEDENEYVKSIYTREKYEKFIPKGDSPD